VITFDSLLVKMLNETLAFVKAKNLDIFLNIFHFHLVLLRQVMLSFYPMEIQYLGHACFRIKGRKIILLTDPFDESVGFKMPKVSADIVTVSHNHQDHNNIKAVIKTTRREPFLISSPGEYEVDGISVLGIQLFHDSESGKKRGENTIYVINLDGIRLIHLGDLGHKLTDKQLEKINGVDILFVPVGGNFTIGPKQAAAIVSQINPKIVIPMHYLTNEYRSDFGLKFKVEDFLNEMEIEAKPIDSLSLTREKLPDEREVIVLKRKK